MDKPIIGVVAPRFSNDSNAFNNFTHIVDNFPRRILEAGGIPVGICFPGGQYYEDVLNLCDGFLFQGGPIIEAPQINTIGYAISHDKPVLGVCLGMQTMAGYEWVYNDLLNGYFDPDKISTLFKIDDEVNFIEKRPGHNELDPFINKEISKSKHAVLLDPDSRLVNIFKDNYLEVPSLHNWSVKDELFTNSKVFKVTGRSLDGTIEVLESIDPNLWLVGVQFHPELEDQNIGIFNELIQKSKVKKLTR